MERKLLNFVPHPVFIFEYMLKHPVYSKISSMLHFYGIKPIFVKTSLEESRATAVFIDYLAIIIIIMSARENNGNLVLDHFYLINRKRRRLQKPRERWFVDFNVVVVTRHCSRSTE